MVSRHENKTVIRQLAYRLGVCFFLIAATATTYWPVRNFGFLNFDDNLYVEVLSKLEREFTFDSVIWSFSHATDVTNYWTPLTWLSLLIDYNLYGLEPGGYHLTNVLLHICNTILLFLVLSKMTGALWRSAFVATLFALHPLHVESVAWVTERKDVLSTFFWLLTIWGYTRYVLSPSAGKYLLALFFFFLGLMSKPMLVTLPFVLLLLDYWPFGRLLKEKNNILLMVREKLPFLVLAVIFGLAAFNTQRHAGTVVPLDDISMPVRIGNTFNSYLQYVMKTFWPSRLSPIYPHPGQLPLWQTCGSFFCLATITYLVLTLRRLHPYLVTGWLWYLGSLVPVIGLVVIGPYAMADRYTYIPLIGLFVALTWGTTSLLNNYRHHRILLSAGALLILILLIPITRKQIGYWQSSEKLFSHTVEITENNYVAHNNLGSALITLGRPQDAIPELEKALGIKPDYAGAHYNLGLAWEMAGQTKKAILEFREVLQIDPDHAVTHNNLGASLIKLNRANEAIPELEKVLRTYPDFLEAHYNLGTAWGMIGRMTEAILEFKEVLRINPYYAEAHYNLGAIFLMGGRTNEASQEFKEALRINPDYIGARNKLQLVQEMLKTTD